MSETTNDSGDPRYPDRIIEGHDYDGIKEYDNPMPGWWLWLFYATIAWSVFYIAGLGLGFIDDYDARLEKGKERVAEKRATATVWEEGDIEALLDDDEALARGEQIYDDECAMCHGTQGEGMADRPAFDDDEWLHGPEMTTQFSVVQEGPGAMPAFGNELSSDDIAAVVAFINTL